MKLYDLLNKDVLTEMIDKEYVNVTKHPQFPLYIYNYSKKCQLEHVWNEVTETCRGLIVDEDLNIIARPFKKFYNYEELLQMNAQIPDEEFEVYEKLDGSLGILYFWENKAYIATRGSFTSSMALHATNVLNEKYGVSLLEKSKTYLFEIIYPEDLHIVTYKDIDDIFLLAVIDNETGIDDDISKWNNVFKCTIKYDGFSDYTKIREAFSGKNREGFVIKFKCGFRMKLKFAEYWKLHFLKSGFTEKQILQYLIDDDKESIQKYLDMFDEEHQIYYNRIIDKFKEAYNSILDKVRMQYKEFDTDKEAAVYFNTCDYPHIMFCIRKGKNIREPIWNLVKRNRKYINDTREDENS